MRDDGSDAVAALRAERDIYRDELSKCQSELESLIVRFEEERRRRKQYQADALRWEKEAARESSLRAALEASQSLSFKDSTGSNDGSVALAELLYKIEVESTAARTEAVAWEDKRRIARASVFKVVEEVETSLTVLATERQQMNARLSDLAAVSRSSTYVF